MGGGQGQECGGGVRWGIKCVDKLGSSKKMAAGNYATDSKFEILHFSKIFYSLSRFT